MTKNKSVIPQILIILAGIVLVNNVLQFSEFLIKYQNATLVILFISLAGYVFLKDKGYKLDW